jgi:hypothetical protein
MTHDEYLNRCRRILELYKAGDLFWSEAHERIHDLTLAYYAINQN